MYLRLDSHSGEPIYRQIVEQVKFRVAAGQLEPGEKLPSIRGLAEELKINPRTVVKAYEELGHAGLVVMRQGQGVFISKNQGSIPVKARRKALAEMARRLLAEASRIGADIEEVKTAIDQIANEMEDKS